MITLFLKFCSGLWVWIAFCLLSLGFAEETNAGNSSVIPSNLLKNISSISFRRVWFYLSLFSSLNWEALLIAPLCLLILLGISSILYFSWLWKYSSPSWELCPASLKYCWSLNGFSSLDGPFPIKCSFSWSLFSAHCKAQDCVQVKLCTSYVYEFKHCDLRCVCLPVLFRLSWWYRKSASKLSLELFMYACLNK